MTLAVVLTFCFLKGEEEDQNKFCWVLLNLRPNMPACVDPVQLLATLAIMDGTLLGVSEAAHLQTSCMPPNIVDPLTHCFDLKINLEQSKTAVFCQIDQTGGNSSPFETSQPERWDSHLATKCFNWLRKLLLPLMTWNLMCCMSAALLNCHNISQANTCQGLGHSFSDRPQMECYLPAMQNFDLMGLAIRGTQDLELVQWVAILCYAQGSGYRDQVSWGLGNVGLSAWWCQVCGYSGVVICGT